MPGEANPADLFTKILGRQVFEKHRKVILEYSICRLVAVWMLHVHSDVAPAFVGLPHERGALGG